MKSDFADTNARSLAYAKAKEALLALARLAPDARNWRPHAVVLAQGQDEPVQLLEYAALLGGRHGVVSRVAFVQGSRPAAAAKRQAELARLRQLTAEKVPTVLHEVVVTPDVEAALPVFLQAHGVGSLKPNLAILGYPRDKALSGGFVTRLRTLAELGLSQAILLNLAGRRPGRGEAGRIDIWWRGYANGSLMLILAHLMTLNPEWQQVRVRILRIAKTEAERQSAHDDLKHLTEVSRIGAEIKVLVSADPFSQTMRRESRDAVALFLGFVLPADNSALLSLFESTARALEGMPPAFLISTSGAADLLA